MKRIQRIGSKRKDRIKTERRLLESGIQMFSKHGFDGATTKMISKNSGVNEALIVRYFGSKQGLLLAIMDQIFSSVRHTNLHYPPCDRLESELINYLLKEMRFLGDQNRLWRIIISHSWSDSKVLKKFKSTHPRVDTRLLERLKLLRDNGEISNDVDLEELCIQTGIIGFTIHILRDSLSSKKTHKEKAAQFFAHAVANGLKPHCTSSVT